jgi:hypothetical protein
MRHFCNWGKTERGLSGNERRSAARKKLIINRQVNRSWLKNIRDYLGRRAGNSRGTGSEVNLACRERRNSTMVVSLVGIVVQQLMQTGRGCEGCEDKQLDEAQKRNSSEPN